MPLDRVSESVKRFLDVLLEIVVELLVLRTNPGKEIVDIHLELTESFSLCLSESADSCFKSIELRVQVLLEHRLLKPGKCTVRCVSEILVNRIVLLLNTIKELPRIVLNLTHPVVRCV